MINAIYYLLKNTFLTMCKIFIYIPSPNLLNVNNNYKFLDILLCICEVMIGHSKLFLEE